MENKKILFVFSSFPGIGGVESVSNNIIDYLGKYFTIYTLSMYSQKGVPASAYISEMLHFSTAHNLNKCILQFNNIVKTKQIDYIINQGLYPDITDIIFNSERNKNIKILSFLHGMPKYEEKLYWQLPHIANTSRKKLFKRQLLSKLGLNKKYKLHVEYFASAYRTACFEGDRIVLLCKEYIDPFLQKYKLVNCREKVTSIENPLSVAFSAQKEVEWNQKKNQVLFMGRLTKEKRVDIILKIWKQISKQTDWELVIAGDGDSLQKLKDFVCKEQIQRVFFTGQVSDPESYYRKAKIILLTSKFEGFPMCLIEAQRFGVVPLVFNISEGVRSIIAYDGGIVVKHGNKKAISRKLLKLIKDENTLQILSKKVRIKSNRYTLDELGKQWISLFKQLETNT